MPFLLMFKGIFRIIQVFILVNSHCPGIANNDTKPLGIQAPFINHSPGVFQSLNVNASGLIRKDAGVGKPTSKGIHAVWKYSTIPGGLELIARNVGSFCNMEIKNPELASRLVEIRKMIDDEISSDMPVLVLLGGTDDGRVYG